MIVGGGPAPHEVTQRFVDLAGGKWRARIAVLPMASSVARSSAITPAGSVLGASGLRVHVLPGGSTFDPVAGRVVRLGPAR
ncbi:MAG: hypothetical protein WKF55_12175 [Gemmatimonadaceae bacterium]